MPSLFRLLFVIGIIVGICYGTMYTLVEFVEPKDREVTIRVPSEKLYKEQ
ncbi:MAG: hypothetical protein ABJE63_16890 [Lentilitoribacter sp.]